MELKNIIRNAALIITLAITMSNAQSIRGYGIKAGLSIAQQDWDQGIIGNVEIDNSYGINFGVFSEFFINSNNSLIIELNYVQKGAKSRSLFTNYYSTVGNEEIKHWAIKLDYLNLSILAKGRYESFISPYVFLGPKIDFEISRSVENDDLTQYKDFNKIRYGIKSGIGLEFKIQSLSLFTEILYDFDLNLLYKTSGLEVSSKSYLFNFGIMF